MKTLTTLVAGAFALIAANFATVAPAQADSFGFHVGRGGFGIHVSNYGYDNGYYRHRRCVTRWDFRHKWYCRRYHRSYYYDDYYPYYNNYHYYPRHRFRGNRHHFRHHNRHWRDGRRHWRGGDRHHRRDGRRGRRGHRNH